MSKTYKYRELVKKLKKYDKRFEIFENKGKGSHKMIYHPEINGRAESFPIPCHGKDGDVKHCYIKDLKKRFCIPDEILPN